MFCTLFAYFYSVSESSDEFPPPPTYEELESRCSLVVKVSTCTFDVVGSNPREKCKKACSSKSTLEELVDELSNFDRKKLRSISEKSTKFTKRSFQKEISLRDQLLSEILSFNRSKLRHVKTVERQFPYLVLNGIRWTRLLRPTEELTFRLKPQKTDQNTQTEHLTVSSGTDSGFVSPVPSTNSENNNIEWRLVEEKVSLIRTEETYYYV